jgi:anti-sigma B factor antagonist
MIFFGGADGDQAMPWTQTSADGALVGRPQGRVDESNWDAFSNDLVAAITAAAAGGLVFIVDLGAVDYMSSRGLRALSTGLSTAKKADVPMRLAAPGTAMREILAISRYDKLFAVFESVEAASTTS